MFDRRSRYFSARRYQVGEDGKPVFKGVRARVIGPATPLLEHGLQPEQRLDALGVHYYNDARLWWRIIDANPDVLCAAQLELIGLPPLPRRSDTPQPQQGNATELGEVLLIPRSSEGGT
ncbi:hypothetical protein [Chitinimonas naiadis]